VCMKISQWNPCVQLICGNEKEDNNKNKIKRDEIYEVNQHSRLGNPIYFWWRERKL
jgi:hypothetical protein